MIINFKIFEEKQLKLFQTTDSVQDITKHFLKKFKSIQQKNKNVNFEKVSDVLNHYDDNKINDIIKTIIDIENNFDNNYHDKLMTSFCDNIDDNTFEKYFKEVLNNHYGKNVDDDVDIISLKPKKNDEILIDFLNELSIDEIDFFYNFIYDYLNEKKLFYSYADYFCLNIDYYNYYLDFLAENRNNSKILIHRMITLPYNIDDLEKKLKENEYHGIGIYWSYDFDGAEAHCGDTGQRIIISAKVDINNVNWDKTFYKSLYSLNDEKEIELYNNITLEIVSITLNDKIQYLLNKKTSYLYHMKDVFKLSNHQMTDVINNFKENIKNDHTIKFENPLIVNV
jgi:hypothetical protein